MRCSREATRSSPPGAIGSSRAAVPPGRRIALSFDDGPDPTWTPRIAALLLRLHVPAAFFVVGDRVARYPGIVSGLEKDGFEIGGHTFTHSDLSGLPDWQRDLQVSMTDSAIAGAAGVRPRFMRPPYSATAAAVDAADRACLRRRRPQGLPDRALRLRRRGLAQPGSGEDRAQRDPARAAGRGGAAPRRRRRPLPDPGRDPAASSPSSAGAASTSSLSRRSPASPGPRPTRRPATLSTCGECC